MHVEGGLLLWYFNNILHVLAHTKIQNTTALRLHKAAVHITWAV